jgi:hypothetical protein
MLQDEPFELSLVQCEFCDSMSLARQDELSQFSVCQRAFPLP